MRLGPFHFGYEAVKADPRRRPLRTDVKSEDDHLNAAQRRKLVSTTRDLRRNYSLVAWAIRKHLDYVASFSFQSKNDDKELDDRISRLVRWWSLPNNFDVAGRHGLKEFIRLAEVCRVVDGDVFFHLLDTGLIQAIEGDRIANTTPTTGAFSKSYNLEDFKRGVKCSKGGRAQAYIVNNRSKKGNRLEFAKIIPAKYMIQFAYWDRFDQIRGISPLSPAINTFQDTHEAVIYALARAKVAQLFALVLKQASAEPAGLTEEAEPTVGNGSGEKYTTDFGKGPVLLQMDRDDEATFLESNQPALEFQKFMQIIIALALKAIDIPYSFYDESFTNYSGSRQALVQYEQSAREKRFVVKTLLDTLTWWRFRLFIARGVLTLPRGMTINDLKWDWQPAGVSWIDPWREAKADSEAINSMSMSRQRICKRMGLDFWEVLNELKQEQDAIDERGIRTSKSSGDSIVIQREGSEMDNLDGG